MTPDPPPSSSNGQSLPQRHRPPLDKLSKDMTEMDLWSFDDLDLDDLSKPDVVLSPRGSGNEIPAPREPRAFKTRDSGNPLEGPSPPDGGERIQMNVNRPRQHSHSGSTPARLSRTESEFDDLENQGEVSKKPRIDGQPPPPAQQPAIKASSAKSEEKAVLDNPALEADDNEFSPVKRGEVRLLSLLPKLRLSKVEGIGLIVLLGMLAVGGLATIVFSLKRLPTESVRAESNDFPVKGSLVVVDSAISYWRAPITDGPSQEIVRRGTKLLPVVELRVQGGAGAIRVLFRNEERRVVGDAVTQRVSGAATLIIPATAGFDDAGMHAAYRTGGSKPWTIEVFEASGQTSPGEDFKRLFEMNISTDRH